MLWQLQHISSSFNSDAAKVSHIQTDTKEIKISLRFLKVVDRESGDEGEQTPDCHSPELLHSGIELD